MAADDDDTLFDEFSRSVLVVLFAIATAASMGSIVVLGKFAPTPPGAVENAVGRYLDWLRIAIVTLIVAIGMDLLGRFLDEKVPLERSANIGGSTVYSIIVASMVLVTFWHGIILLVSPIAVSLVPYEKPRYMVWTFGTKFSLGIVLTATALVLILSVFLLFLRLLIDIVIYGMENAPADGH